MAYSLRSHCYFSAQMITQLQKKLEAKETDPAKRQRARKINSSARVLTSEEGQAELQQLKEQDQLRKQKETEADEKARRERRADLGHIFTGALSKTKKKEEHEGLAAALALPSTGKKEELFARIIAHFAAFPHLKLENRFKDMFPST